MPKPNSIYSYNLGKPNGLGSSGNIYSFTNRQNGGLGPAAFLPNRNVVAPIIQKPVVTQLTEYVGEYDGEYYVAILFTNNGYIYGLNDVFELFNKQFPKKKINFIKYIVDDNLSNIENSLNEFITSHPNSNKITISEYTSILNRIVKFISNNNLNILSLSVSSTALTTQKLKNTITYGYYLSTLITSYFAIIEDFGFENIVILFDSLYANKDFINNFKNTIYTQNNLLKKINIIEYTLSLNTEDSFIIPNKSCVFLLSNKYNIENFHLNKIIKYFNNNNSSIICATDDNYDFKDIFGNIPTIVPFLTSAFYTSTTDLVYNSLNDKTTINWSVYTFYDILYTLNYCANNKIFITKKTYINTSPFKTIPPAWNIGFSINESINGFNYGSYDFIFTKDSIIETERLLYDLNNQNGSVSVLPDSKSIFKSISIFPTLPTPLIYLDRDYIKIYKNDVLQYVKFDINNTITNDSKLINTSEISTCKFIVTFDRTSFFLTYLEKIFDNKKLTYPNVNLTMSKIAKIKYIK